MTSNVCSAWATTEDLGLCPNCPPTDGLNLAVFEDLLLACSSMLNKKVGYLWPGLCEFYVRPCSQFGGTGLAAWHGDPWDWMPAWWRWLPSWGVCECGGAGLAGRGCSCCGVSEIMLGESPIAEITEVKVDGVVLTPEVDYRLDDDNFLVRIGGHWPCCQRITAPDDEEGTFSVAGVAGADPPIEAKLAALSWAADLYLACQPGECSIPVEIAGMVRENVDYEFRVARREDLEAGFVGNLLADQLIAAYRDQATPPADVWSPDVSAAVRRPRSPLGP